MNLRKLPAVVLVWTLGWVGHARAEMQPAAVAILERMFKTYAAAPAFACEGSCDDREDGSSLPPDHRTMKVLFARPDRFRLAWTQRDFHGGSGTSVIFTRRGQVFLLESGADHEEPEPSLGQAINSCAGISLGLSYLVPALLLNDRGYLNFTSLRQLADAKSKDGRSCWKLAGETNEGARWELLIDRENCALREAAEVNVLSTGQAHAIRTQYRFTNIRFEGAWPHAAFAQTASASERTH